MNEEEAEGEEPDGIQSTKEIFFFTREIGKLDSARVLVEVTANDELPHTLEISYPPIGDTPARIAANVLKDVNANSFAASKSNVINGDDDGFVTVGKNNKPIGEQSNVKQGDQNSFSKSKGVYGSFNQLQQSNKNMKMGQRNDVLQKSVDKKKPLMEPSSSKFVVKKNQVDLSNFKPKVLVRGSGSYGSTNGVLSEIVPVANYFQALDDQVMEDKEKAIEAAMDIEYENDWSLREMDFFYQNCHKYGLDPSFDDDDVQTKEGGMADEMRPEYVDGCGQDQGNCVASDAILFPMIKLFSWNIKGLNNSPNQKQVIDLLHEGDFNVILDPSERSAGSSSITSSMIDFRECLAKIEVDDLVRPGLRLTWNKSPGGTTDGLLKKLDQVLSNFGFVEKFSNANAQFLPFIVSDHFSYVLVIPSGVSAKPKPFIFANYLANKAEFLPIVERVRNLHVSSLVVCYLVTWPLSAGRSIPVGSNTVKGNLESSNTSGSITRRHSSPIVNRGRIAEPPGRGCPHVNGYTAESLGRNISKKSLDMAIKHMDIRNGGPRLSESTLFPQSIRSNNSTGLSAEDQSPHSSKQSSEGDIYESSMYDAILLKEDLKNTRWLHSANDKIDEGSFFGNGFKSLHESFGPL
ncbi:translation initiation factor IF-2-like protein isoform X1 [Tanacetum coccineum]